MSQVMTAIYGRAPQSGRRWAGEQHVEDARGLADRFAIEPGTRAGTQRGALVATDQPAEPVACGVGVQRSEEHTSELQSPYVISYAAFCLKKHRSSRAHCYRPYSRSTGLPQLRHCS